MLLTMIVTFLYNKFADDMDFVFCSIKKRNFAEILSRNFRLILKEFCRNLVLSIK